jgi:5'-AMP-activated protein kinase catalytic alpha subunit
MSSNPLKVRINDTYNVEISRKLDKYDVLRIIDSGGFSVVGLVTERHSQEPFACKVTPRDLLVDYAIFDRFEQEVRILQSLNHPSIVRIYDVIYHPTFIGIIVEYCEGGNFGCVIRGCGKFDEETARSLFHQLVDGVEYLHSRNIAHRDLKLENCLFACDYTLPVADLGLCHTTSPDSLLATPFGSIDYAPPEIVDGEGYDGKAADVWATGVILHGMIVGYLPWPADNPAAAIERMASGELQIPRFVSPEARGLIQRMLTMVPAQRPTVTELAAGVWVTGNFKRHMSIEHPRIKAAPVRAIERPSRSTRILTPVIERRY